jgi:ribosome-binding factor A
MKKRLIRINDEIARASANVIRSEMSDPRIGSVVSVMRAETTADLKFCKIFIGVLGDAKAQQETMTALAKAAGFIRCRLAEIINLRLTPTLTFVHDDSVEHGMRMNRLIEEVNRGANS